MQKYALYESPEFVKKSEDSISVDTIGMYGRKWQISAAIDRSNVPNSIRNRPANVLFGGLTITIVAAFFTYLLLQRRLQLLIVQQEKKVKQAKDDLLSMASHQLRTPATGVKQYVGMVLQGYGGKVTDKTKTLLEKAYENNEHQLHIINEFLYIAKIEAGQLKTNKVEVNVRNMVRDIVDSVHADIDLKQHRVDVKILKDHFIFADESNTRIIFENLLTNAIKYTPDGGKIVITSRIDGKYVAIDFVDNGIGILEKNQEKLFKKFERIPNSLSKKTTGSGIGLYLALHLANLNRGTILYQNNKKQGSTFTVLIPRVKSVKNITEKN
jgi:signal transduction histidine kinase